MVSIDWNKKNDYYHKLIEGYLTFHTSDQDSLLVLGCGKGGIFDNAPFQSAVGIDLDPSVIQEGQNKFQSNSKVEFHTVKDYLSLPDLNRTFDGVIVKNVIAELKDIQALLERLRVLMNPSSRLVMNFHSHLWSPIIQVAETFGLKRPTGRTTWVTKEDILNLFILTGFELVTHGKCILLPKNPFGLGGFINRWVAPLPIVENLCLENIVMARPIGLNENPKLPSVTVVIPARNEAGNIENAIHRLPSMGVHTEIIFVEGNSIDNTWDEIKRVQDLHPERDIKVLKQSGKGKADAVQHGFKEAKGDLLMILDADLTVDPEDLPKFFNAIVENKGDFINGSRLVYPLEEQAMRFLNMLANKLFGWLFTWLLGQRYRDTLCGTKVLWKKDYNRIANNRRFFGDFDPFGDFDLIFGATKLGLKTIEIPVRYKERTYGTTNIKRFRHGLLLFRMIFLAARLLKFKLAIPRSSLRGDRLGSPFRKGG
jgi:glycosyltransferase involved in cell wall biosynthesis/2-polyprenyl-3-methyl-5-hydroxy-6-metoxy-1,4-benzoquinol methylase